jgi:hypothetical protein
MQRQTSAYFSIETRLRWGGPCVVGQGGGSGGAIARELTTGHGAALGLLCDSAKGTVRLGF